MYPVTASNLNRQPHLGKGMREKGQRGENTTLKNSCSREHVPFASYRACLIGAWQRPGFPADAKTMGHSSRCMGYNREITRSAELPLCVQERHACSKDLGCLGDTCKRENEGERGTIDLLSPSSPEEDSPSNIYPPWIHRPCVNYNPECQGRTLDQSQWLSWMHCLL